VSRIEPGIYRGTLRHRRFSPIRHEFSYPLFMVLLDIDRIPELTRISWFLSHNCWNWASFDDRDHFGDSRLPLRKRLEADAASHGLQLPQGPIYLLTHLRYLGYAFNPVSFFYCCGASGVVEMMMAEVNNTYGESRNYWLSPSNQKPLESARFYHAPKTMYVSPFIKMDIEYDFIFTPPGENLVVHMNTKDRGKIFFDATLKLEKQPWTSKSLHQALLQHPWMTAKVIGAIHWQALQLYFRRIRVFSHPLGNPASLLGRMNRHASAPPATPGKSVLPSMSS
jgi:hypothetical protein